MQTVNLSNFSAWVISSLESYDFGFCSSICDLFQFWNQLTGKYKPLYYFLINFPEKTNTCSFWNFQFKILSDFQNMLDFAYWEADASNQTPGNVICNKKFKSSNFDHIKNW
jgi:hypothetical protein